MKEKKPKKKKLTPIDVSAPGYFVKQYQDGYRIVRKTDSHQTKQAGK